MSVCVHKHIRLHAIHAHINMRMCIACMPVSVCAYAHGVQHRVSMLVQEGKNSIRYMSQVTCRFPQACRVGNPQWPRGRLLISVHALQIGHVASAAREKFRAEVGTIYTLVATSHL